MNVSGKVCTLIIVGFFFTFAAVNNAHAYYFQNDAGTVQWDENGIRWDTIVGSGNYARPTVGTGSSSGGSGGGIVTVIPSLPGSASTSQGNHIFRNQIFRRATPQGAGKVNQGCFPVRRQPTASSLSRISPAKYTTSPGDERTTGTGTAGSDATAITADDSQATGGTGVSEGPADKPPLPTPLDSDGDGYYNYAEEALGTDPYHAARYPDMPSSAANTDKTATQYYRDQVESGQGNGRLYGADSADGVRTGARSVKPGAAKSGGVIKAIPKGASTGGNTGAAEGAKVDPGMIAGAVPAAGSGGEGAVGPATELTVGPPIVNPASAVFYMNMWEAGAQDGVSLGINPSAGMQSGDGSVMFTMPIVITFPDSGDPALSLGGDCSFAKSLCGNTVSIGFHFNGIGHMVTYEDAYGYSDVQFDFSYGGGPFGSYFVPMSEKLGVSLGCLLEFQDHIEGDSSLMAVPGLNVGYALADTVGLNCYVLLFEDLDNDLSYTQLGGDLSFQAGSGSLSLGAKTTSGLEGYSSFELYAGGQWRY